jgi:hypothetical protein
MFRALRRFACRAGVVVLASACLSAAAPAQTSPDAAVRALCAAPESAPATMATRAAAIGGAGLTTATTLASSTVPAEVMCGVAVLAAARDTRAVAPLLASVRADAFRSDTFRLVRWAAYLAGGPDVALGRQLLPLLSAFDVPGIRAAASDDAIRLLGEIDDDAARDRLMAEFARPASDAALDAAVHALARQREPRARDRIAAIGQDAVATRSGNTTFEQARRMGAVAFYQLVLGPDTVPAGLAMLRQLALPDQEDTAAWAAQTLCERAVRRPADREPVEKHRAAVVGEFDRLGLSWARLQRGAFPCPLP